MAATVSFTCPKCKAQLKGPAEMEGKKARCKKCAHVFVLRAGTPARSAIPAPKGKPAKPAAAAAAAAKGPGESGTTYTFKEDQGPAAVADDTSKAAAKVTNADNNPYDITDLDLTPRCPFCAQELESADSIICLHCGYNNQTRTLPAVERTYANTGMDIMLWLLPGIACVLGCLALGGAIAYLWMSIDPKPYEKEWYADLVRPGQVWGTIVSLGGIFFAGRFAVKRLVLHPTPPETKKR